MYSQTELPGFKDNKPRQGRWPIFKVTNLRTGEYAEVVHSNIGLVCDKLRWDYEDIEFTKNGYSNQYGKVLKRTYRKEH